MDAYLSILGTSFDNRYCAELVPLLYFVVLIYNKSNDEYTKINGVMINII